MKMREACLGAKFTWKDENGVAFSMAMSGNAGELHLSNENLASIIACKETRDKAIPPKARVTFIFTKNISINSEDVTLVVNGGTTQNKLLFFSRPNVVSLNGVNISISTMLFC